MGSDSRHSPAHTQCLAGRCSPHSGTEFWQNHGSITALLVPLQVQTSTLRPVTALQPSTRPARMSTRMWWSFFSPRVLTPTKPTRTACSHCTLPPRRATIGQSLTLTRHSAGLGGCPEARVGRGTCFPWPLRGLLLGLLSFSQSSLCEGRCTYSHVLRPPTDTVHTHS